MSSKRIRASLNVPLIALIPLINILFLLLIVLSFSPVFTTPDIINVKLPRAMTSDVVQSDHVVIVITAENVIYVDDRIVAHKDLQESLGRLKSKNVSVLIKADRRSSVGRVVDVWNLCRMLGLEKVNIATNQEQ